MRIQVGVMGSAGGRITKAAREKAYELGVAIAEHNCVLVTGASPGLPYESVQGCRKSGGVTAGISPALDLWEHIHRYDSPYEEFDVMIYTGDGLMGREVTGIRSCDIVVVVGGRSGTLGEFSIAYDEGKVIGVLSGTGGIADHIDELIKIIHKDTGAQIVFDEDPRKLMDGLLELHSRRKGTPPPRIEHPEA